MLVSEPHLSSFTNWMLTDWTQQLLILLSDISHQTIILKNLLQLLLTYLLNTDLYHSTGDKQVLGV